MIAGALEELRKAIDELAAADPVRLADPDTITQLHLLKERLEAVTTRATASFDASQAWADDGARSASAWLAYKLRVPSATAKRCTWLGRELRHLPVAEAAWLRGEITNAHVAALARARTAGTAEAMARDEEQLVGYATSMRYSHFVRALDYWAQHADPDGSEKTAQKLYENRSAFFSTTFGGVKQLDATFDPIGGAIFENELKRQIDKLFEADWAEATERLGREPSVIELRRTHTQRRLDALVEMAKRSAAMPQGARKPAPLFTVFVGWETLQGRICELANGTVVAPGSLVPYLTEADFQRVVFDSPSRVIDVGATRRLFEGATRRAVEVRDRECFHETCEERDRLQIDHVLPFSWDGPTIEANGRAACAKHNQARHRKKRRR